MTAGVRMRGDQEFNRIIHNLSHDYTCKLVKMLLQRNKRAHSRKKETFHLSLEHSRKYSCLLVGWGGSVLSVMYTVECKGPLHAALTNPLLHENILAQVYLKGPLIVKVTK